MSSAGTVYWVNGWIYFILVLTYEIAYILILMKINPGLLNERGKFIKEGTKFFDKIYAASYLPLSYLILVIAGLDAVRYHWSTMPVWLTFLGLITILFAFYVSLKAISVNSYFECTVLIQKKPESLPIWPLQCGSSSRICCGNYFHYIHIPDSWFMVESYTQYFNSHYIGYPYSIRGSHPTK
nr:hypothetical protein [Methanobacterium formicicum]